MPFLGSESRVQPVVAGKVMHKSKEEGGSGDAMKRLGAVGGYCNECVSTWFHAVFPVACLGRSELLSDCKNRAQVHLSHSPWSAGESSLALCIREPVLCG